MFKYMSIVLVFVVCYSPIAKANLGDRHSGNISDITVIKEGILITLDTGIPADCAGTPSNQMLVKNEYTSMVSVVLAMWASRKVYAKVFVDNYASGGTVYCELNQLNPTD